MMFQFNVNQQFTNDNNMALQQAAKTCAEHPGCKDCPLLNGDMNIGNSVIRCETARMKRGN